VSELVHDHERNETNKPDRADPKPPGERPGDRKGEKHGPVDLNWSAGKSEVNLELTHLARRADVSRRVCSRALRFAAIYTTC
jgi:hypothetical protein